ncbi:single-stranded-DNA-specific exonuclease RecJ [Patescibacteria group bacterium]|nr:single-stranded-DNA-specific exonuclease RecJ [Patescibacteria group bacterium]
MSPLVARLLAERGITDVSAFLEPSYEMRHDPFLLPDMKIAVERILTAIEKKEKIAVWHDYDCDGIPGGSLLADFFTKVEYPVRMMVAERSEGYGLNEAGIRALADEGVSLLITVDCGITENENVALAQSLGIDVIVTDHHLPQSILPPGIAVVNPHREDSLYPEKVLCGTGVAFKLVEALIQKGKFNIPVGWEKWLLDLVALATVADMVPLIGENRTLVKFGLRVMAKGRRVGLAALLRKERIPLPFITEDDIAFSIAPKINAASRMESPRIGVELLTTTDEARANELANKLVSLNKARKLAGARVAKEVKHRLESTPQQHALIVMGSQEWRPSLLGIAGNNIIETYKKTVCLWGKDGELIKGSIRSAGDVNVVALMTAARQVLTDFGGHESSGGFSIAPEKIHELESALRTAYDALLGDSSGESSVTLRSSQTSPSEPRLEAHDGVLTLSEVTDRTYESLRMLAPFGIENEKPVFRFTDVVVDAVAFFGAHDEHVRLKLSDERGASIEAIAFFVPRTAFKDDLELLSPGDRVTLDATIEKSHFMGRTSLRLRLENLTV